MATVRIVKKCVRCNGHNVVLRGHTTASGTKQYSWYCADCERWAESPPRWLPHRELGQRLERQGVTLNDVPLLKESSEFNRCEICGEPGEVHHWAPQAYKTEFCDDWWAYPTSILCVRHHRQWHDIVTPHLGEKGGDNGTRPNVE